MNKNEGIPGPVVAILVAVALLVGVALGALRTPRCYEDEVITWDGNAHTICVPWDAIKDAALEEVQANG